MNNTVAIVFGSLIACLIGVVVYLFVLYRRNEKRMSLLCEEQATDKLELYKALIQDVDRRIREQQKKIQENVKTFNKLKEAVEGVPDLLKDPEDLTIAFNKLLKEKRGRQ